SRYFAQVTHEMRNPINGVIGLTSLLMLSQLDETQRRQLKLAKTAAQMLLALCNDVLDLAKIEAGKFELQCAPVDVAAALREAAAVFKPMADQKGLAFTLCIDAALPRPLVCDRQRLQQVVLNLLGNAIKFTAAGSVGLQAGWQPAGEGAGTLTVEVADTGVGIDAAGQARLFQEFVQTEAGRAQGQGGTGLGLAMCRSLLELMGGGIAVDSEPGQGSRFRFTLPLARSQAGQLQRQA
ncbi:MAG: hybrid sensor histidine kinase/response regulator, partial [Burkholderiales bacterium]|nr:hybrid sensor histidine kinase/response regulator [Burkholderiales bacterium]